MIPNETRLMWENNFHLGPLNGKAPFLPGGFKSFTRDWNIIERWSRQYRSANFGGWKPGVLFIDVDTYAGGDVSDLDLPTTLTFRTGRGGLHLAFLDSGPTRGQLADHPHVDLKPADKGFVVLPGSIHPETGKRYTIEINSPIAQLPGALLPLVRPRQLSPSINTSRRVVPERRSAGLVRKVEEASGGGRNQITFWAFCRCIERGEQSLIEDIRRAALSTGLDDREVDTCLRSAHRTVGRVA